MKELDFCNALDTLKFSETEKERVAQKLAAGEIAAKYQKQEKRLPHRLAMAALAIVLATAAVVGVGAAGGLKPVKKAFAPFLGEDVAQTEIIDKIGHPIGASVSSSGITMTADAIIGDKHNACVIYTLSKDDGSRILPKGVTPDRVSVVGITYLMGATGNFGSGQVFDEDPNDNEIQYMNTIGSHAEELQQGNIRAWFQRIDYYPNRDGEGITLAEGNWDMRFEVAYEDSSVALSSGEVTKYAGWDCTIRELTISSLGFHVVLETGLEAWENEWESERKNDEPGAKPVPKVKDPVSLMSIPVKLKKTDGSVIDFSDRAGCGMDKEGGKTVVYWGGVFPEIIPLEEIESIAVNDIEYFIDP